MVSKKNEQDDGYPWLSWAITGVLTLMGVLVFGLVVSLRNPRTQATAPAGVPARGSQQDTVSQPAAINKPAAVPVSSAAAEHPAQPIVPKVIAADPVAAPPVDSAKPVPAVAPTSPDAAPPVVAEAPPAAVPPPAKVEPPKPVVPPAAQPAAQPAKPAEDDPVKRAAFVKAVAEARQSMARRMLAASRQRLETAATNAQSNAEHAELDRLMTIQDHLEQFWEVIRSAVAAMQATDEIVLSATNRVSVIECSREELVVQREGRPHRYRIEALPMDLLTAISKTAIQPTRDSKVILGSFHAVDGQGNRAEARKLWHEAIVAGDADGKLLLPELDVPRDAVPADR